jgi:hypothetical protein
MKDNLHTGELHFPAEKTTGRHVEEIGASATKRRVHGRLQIELDRLHPNSAQIRIRPEILRKIVV